VTNLTELTPRYIVYAYQKRWAVESSQPYYDSSESLYLVAA
jgi:hypothetical protein